MAPPAPRFDLGLRLSHGQHVEGRDVGPRLGQPERERLPEPARRARDERDAPVQPEQFEDQKTRSCGSIPCSRQ